MHWSIATHAAWHERRSSCVGDVLPRGTLENRIWIGTVFTDFPVVQTNLWKHLSHVYCYRTIMMRKRRAHLGTIRHEQRYIASAIINDSEHEKQQYSSGSLISSNDPQVQSQAGDSARVMISPRAVGRSHRLQKKLRLGGTQQRMELKARQQGTIHSATHKVRPATSNSTHLRLQTFPSLNAVVQIQQYIVESPTERWKRHNHGVKLAEHDLDTNLSNLEFADDILLISGSLKHTTAMLDDITTATMAHGLQLHPRKPAEETTRWQFKECTSRSYRQK